MPEDFAAGLRELEARMQAALAKVDWDRLRAGLEQVPVHAEALGAAGWTMPNWSTPGEVADILREARTSDIDDVFLRHYEADDGALIEELRTSLQSHGSLARWQPLIAECVSAFDAGQYRLVVPVMLTVVDGAVVSFGDKPRLTNPVKSIPDILKSQKDGSMLKAAWISVAGFVHGIFKSHSFEADAPDRLNRHWILHGRDEPNWSKIDALRVMQGVDTIGTVAVAAV